MLDQLATIALRDQRLLGKRARKVYYYRISIAMLCSGDLREQKQILLMLSQQVDNLHV